MEANITREELVFDIKLAEQAERYDEMWQRVKDLAKMDGEFQEHLLFTLALGNRSRRHRIEYRTISAIETKLGAKAQDHQWELTRMYLKKILDEHEKFLLDVINVIDNDIMPKIIDIGNLVTFYKIKANRWNEIYWLKQGEERIHALNQAKISHETGYQYSKQLDALNSSKLGFIVQYTTFFYETLNEPLRAVSIAGEAFNAAVAIYSHMDEAEPIEPVLSVLRDNLTLWTDAESFDPKTGHKRNEP
jgi:14-3-3 protein epsilon